MWFPVWYCLNLVLGIRNLLRFKKYDRYNFLYLKISWVEASGYYKVLVPLLCGVHLLYSNGAIKNPKSGNID